MVFTTKLTTQRSLCETIAGNAQVTTNTQIVRLLFNTSLNIFNKYQRIRSRGVDMPSAYSILTLKILIRRHLAIM